MSDLRGLDEHITGHWGEDQGNDDPFNVSGVPSEQALCNVAACVLAYTEITRQHNGRGRRPTYAADAVAIRDAARQLAEMVLGQLGEQA